MRQWIFNLPKRNDAIVIERSEWHYEQDVYRKQLLGANEDQVNAKIRKQYEQEYIEIMKETVFCLCPSGSGPNSIRLWEAIEFGCLPVVLSDNLELFKGEDITVIPVKEELRLITELPDLLAFKRALLK